MLGLYLHIPFCEAICSYCNFNRGLYDTGLKRRYVEALGREIREAGDGRPTDTVFFGGGTPSLLDPDDVAGLLRVVRDAYALTPDAEVTLETNPETVTRDRLEAFLEAGVSRISFGVQSFDDGELQRIGRLHSAARAVEAVAAARVAGCANVSLDLMFWLPGQSPQSWRRTLDRAIALGPDHLSLYLLELYPNAPLKDAMARARQAPDPTRGASDDTPGSSPPALTSDWVQAADDAAADMYLDGLAQLDAVGYEQYEISNVARAGRASHHNLKYWQGGAWRGFGCGAHSTLDGQRWKNTGSTVDYVDRIGVGASVRAGIEALTIPQRVEEALFTGLRLSAGVDRRNFLARYGVDPWVRYGQALEPYRKEGWLWSAPGRFGLTRRGMLVANEILSTFV